MIDHIKISNKDQEKNRELLATIDPADLENDYYDYSKLVVRKPWGHEYLLFENDECAVWILHIKKGFQTSMHSHPKKKTSLIVLQGEVTCSTLQGDFPKKSGEGLVIDKGTFHQTSATSTGVFVMEIESPVNKRDLLRLKDSYGRAGTGYEDESHYSRNLENYNHIVLEDREIKYNRKKRFGECSLIVEEDSITLDSIKELADDDLICLLQGRIKNKDDDIFCAGDSFTVGQLRSEKEVHSVSVQYMLIKKIDCLIKATDLVVQKIFHQGVKEVFFSPGDSNVHLMDSLAKDGRLLPIALHSDESATLAAEGFSKIHREPAVVFLSGGANIASSVRGIANSYIDSIPMVIIVGQSRSDHLSDSSLRQLGNKEISVKEFLEPITKQVFKIRDAREIDSVVDQAFTKAKTGRPGPTVIELPIDIQGKEFDREESFKDHSQDPMSLESQDNYQTEIETFLSMLESAERPVFLIGSGLRTAGAIEHFKEVIAKIKIPILFSRGGADLLPDSHPLAFGRPGTYGQRRSNFIVQNSDLVICLGSRLSVPMTGRNSQTFARAAKKVMVDIDSQELTKSTLSIDLKICADLKDFLKQFSSNMGERTFKKESWLKSCQNFTEAFPIREKEHQHQTFINPYAFVHELSKKLKDDAVIVVDGGPIQNCVMQAFEFKENQRLVVSAGLEAPGFSLPASIGASFASGKQVICLTETTGSSLNLAVFQSLFELKADVKIFNLSNRLHSHIRTIQKDYFAGRFVGTNGTSPSQASVVYDLAKVFQISSVLVQNPLDLSGAIDMTLSGLGPSLCDIRCDVDQELIPRQGHIVKDDGKWIAKPLEDMYPFLSSDELRKYMIIPVIEED